MRSELRIHVARDAVRSLAFLELSHYEEYRQRTVNDQLDSNDLYASSSSRTTYTVKNMLFLSRRARWLRR